MKEDIHIVLSSSNEFVPYCATTMASILYNANKSKNIHFYILTYNITTKNKKQLDKLKKIKNCTIEYPIFDEKLLDMFAGIKIPPHVTKMTYARILIPDILPQIDKAIFIDSDTIVRTDISRLYDIDISKSCFAAVEDGCSEYHANRLWRKSEERYFNCGVLVINSKKLRQINYIEQIKKQISLNGFAYQICDQDVLNDTFHNLIQPINISWNFHHEKFEKMNFYKPKDIEQYKKILENPCIMHYTGAEKPWYPTTKVLFKSEYLFYFRLTPFYQYLKFQKYITDNQTLWALSWKDIPLFIKKSRKENIGKTNKMQLKQHINYFMQKIAKRTITSEQYTLSFLGQTILQKNNTPAFRSIKLLGITVYKKQPNKNNTISDKQELLNISKQLMQKIDYISGLLNTQNSFNKKLVERIANLKCILEAQKMHPITFLPYKNAFKGKDVVLVCTGPTAKKYTPIPNAIHVGVNGAIYLDNVKLDFLFIQDYTLHQKGNETLNSDANLYVGNNCKKFYGIIPDYHLSTIQSCIERIPFSMCQSENISQYVIEDIVCNNIAQDLSREPIGNFLGTPFSALQFILYTNPRKIYLVGWDCGSGYAYNKQNAINPANYQIEIIEKYFIPFINKNYPHIKIISVNPVGLRGYFEDKDI